MKQHHNLEWVKRSPYFAYSEFKWDVFYKEEEKDQTVVPLYYSLPKGMFTKFLVNYIRWLRKDGYKGTYEELIAISVDAYGGEENYPDWLYYELSLINPEESFNYFSLINIFTKAIIEAYSTYHVVHDVPKDVQKEVVKQQLLSLYSSIDSLDDTSINKLQLSLSLS